MAERARPIRSTESIRAYGKEFIPPVFFEPIPPKGQFKYVKDLTASGCFCGPDEMYGPINEAPRRHEFPPQSPMSDDQGPFIERKKKRRWLR
jgi:hypothetical protein